VYDQSEAVMLDEEGVIKRLQNERLRIAVDRVFVHLELSQDINKDSAIEGGLAVNGSDNPLDLCESQPLDFLHDGYGPLHLDSLKRHQRKLGMIKIGNISSASAISIKRRIILLNK